MLDASEGVVHAWRPTSFTPEAADFARDCVVSCGPLSQSRARTLLWSCASLCRFGLGIGLDPVPAVLLRPSVIERFVVVGLASASPSRRRDIRTNLRFVARVVVGELYEPSPVPLPRSRAKAPYSAVEIMAYLALADAQPSLARRMRLQALICLGAGAGLCGGDLRSVRGLDVARRFSGLVVEVHGRSPRFVPVMSSYHGRLMESAAFAGEGYLTGGLSPSRHNLTTRLVSSVSGGLDLDRLEVSRLRASWLVACAERIGLAGLFAAAGFSFSQQLCDLVADMAVPDTEELVALLGS